MQAPPDPALLRLGPGPVRLADHDPAATPGFAGGKQEGKRTLKGLGDELADLQELLFAHGRSGDPRRVLVVLQGMDTSGKGGIVRHVAGLLDPQGVHVHAFSAPTPEERAHDFLWRVRAALPVAGRIGFFDRSHYEDVLAAPVRGLASPLEVERRFAAIADFEQELVDDGCTVVKVFLHLSADAQREQLLSRLADPTKRWKFDPGDVDDRALWPAYQAAYEQVLSRTSTPHAPWYVVPADHKWYRRLAVGSLLLETLRGLELRWPEPDYDVEEQRWRLLATGDPAVHPATAGEDAS